VGDKPEWSETFSFIVDDPNSNALIKLVQNGKEIIRREMRIEKIVQSVASNNGKEWLSPFYADANERKDPAPAILNVGFQMGRPADEEMAGCIIIGDQMYQLAPEGADDSECIWINGVRYLKMRDIQPTIKIDDIDWQEGCGGLDLKDPLVFKYDIDGKMYYRRMTNALEAKRFEDRDKSLIMIAKKIYVTEPEGDKTGLETTIVNGKCYYRSEEAE